MTSLPHHLSRLAVVATAAASLTACGDTVQANKAGAHVERPVTLRLEMPDAGDEQGSYFARAVERRSHGTIHIKIDPTGYVNAVPADENKLAPALMAGKEKIAYMAARGWAAAGIGEYKALMAPFAITTEQATIAAASGPVAAQALAALPKSVVGVALIPAEPRRVLATRELTTPGAYQGLTLRINDNLQAAADFSALGAVPIQGMAGEDVGPQLQQHKLDAVEAVPARVLANHYFSLAPELTSYAVFPKLQVIAVNRQIWSSLSPRQRAAIKAAAQDTLASATKALPTEEKAELKTLCKLKVSLTVPTDAQLQQLVQAAAPVTNALAADPQAGPMLAALAKLPGAGPQPVASPLPAECGGGSSGAPAKIKATIPNGAYVTTTTVADHRAQGVPDDPKWDQPITWTTTFHDGRFRITSKPIVDDPPLTGTYETAGDEVTFTYSTGIDEAPETLKWSYFNHQLGFKIVLVSDEGARAQFASHPWRKVS